MASAIKAYSMPLIMLSAAIIYQLVVIPRAFPPSHYDVLGIKRYSSVEEVKEAYEKLSSKWNSGLEVSNTVDFIKIRYAYELLTNPLWKRNYDLFGVDENIQVIAKLKEQYARESFSSIDLPLLDATGSDPEDHAFNVTNSKDSQNFLQDMTMPWLVQAYSLGSHHCAQFSPVWKRIAALLEGVANTGAVELGNVQLATYLAERKPTGKPFFRGLPSLVAFPPGCKSSDCIRRFEGELSADAVTDWFATKVLGLPRVLYYSKETLGPKFLAKCGSHKVKVIFFSKTGERATPFVRQAAKIYSAYASFASVLWQEEDSSFWWNTFEVETPPAIVFMKDPGVKPLVHYGSVNSSYFLHIMERNKQQELPQLRALTAMELGCDARGYSRAGQDSLTWYCVILAGRLSLELNKMRETMRRVQDTLLKDSVSSVEDQSSAPSALALKNKRLTFAWLDGETQMNYCQFYLSSETSFETCGPKRSITDVPRLFIVRYKRNATEEDKKPERKPRSIFNALQDEDVDPASQLVAKYNGSDEVSEIIHWVSKIIEDGDSRDLPFFRSKTPELVPEDEDIFSRSAQNILSKSVGLKERIWGIVTGTSDWFGDPRIGPALLLGALLSLGTIYLQRNHTSNPSQSNQPTQPTTTDEIRTKQRKRTRKVPKKDQPPSITDAEPKDAYQMPLSSSDSE